MEPNRRRTVTVSFDGGRSVTLRLELHPVVRDDMLYLRLGGFLTNAIQHEALKSDGITWDEEDLRENKERLRGVVQRFLVTSSPVQVRRASRRRRSIKPRPSAHPQLVASTNDSARK